MVTTTLARPPLTPQEVEAFTEGDCWAFALELHRLGGFPLALIATEPLPGEPWGILDWCHAVVQVGDLYLDAKGLATGEELIAHWGSRRVARANVTRGTIAISSWGTTKRYYAEAPVLVPIPHLEAYAQATALQEPIYEVDRVQAAERLLAWLSAQ